MTAAPLVSASVFRAYDIRGVVDTEINAAGMELLGRAVAEEARGSGIDRLLLGCDGRLSSPRLGKALRRGLLGGGCKVVELGRVPTPLLYFAAHHTEVDSGVMLTASHNPANYNGLKILFRRNCLADDQIQNIRRRVEIPQRVKSPQRRIKHLDIVPAYIKRISDDITLSRPLKVVIDCGNAVAGGIAPGLFQALGCEVIPLFCKIDGRFPNHHPDPTVPANLQQLAAEVRRRQAHIGLAFDGDGDRLGVVNETGRFIDADRILAALLGPIAEHHPGAPVVFDVKCSRHLARLITAKGMRPVMHRSGHSFMKRKMQQTGAPLGGEFAAHIFIKDRWYGFDDGMYAAARLLEVLSRGHGPASALFDMLPPVAATPELSLPVAEADKPGLMARIRAEAAALEPELIEPLITLDGLRAEFPAGWGLLRASNTVPALLLRFEADTMQDLQQIQDRFLWLLGRVDGTLKQQLAQQLHRCLQQTSPPPPSKPCP